MPIEEFRLPDEVSYAIIDFSDYDILTNMKSYPQAFFPKIQNFIEGNPWYVELASGEVVLLRRDLKVGQKLVERSTEPFYNPSTGPQQLIDNKISLIHYMIGQHQTNGLGRIPITFFWHSEEETTDHYELKIRIRSPYHDAIEFTHIIGYSVSPTGTWKKGEFIKENYWLPLPDGISPADSQIKIYYLNPRTGKSGPIE